jgi:hypothetical protein
VNGNEQTNETQIKEEQKQIEIKPIKTFCIGATGKKQQNQS